VDESDGFVDAFAAQAAARNVTWAAAYQGDVQDLERVLADAGFGSAASGHGQPGASGKAVATGEPGALFDFAYARWVLCFVKDPRRVVRAAARLLKPGARFCIQDYFCYSSMSLAPKDPAFTAVVDQVDRAWRDRGGDPDVVGRLPGLLAESGFRVTHLDVNHRIARPGDFMWTWPTVFWESVLPRLVASGHIMPAMRTAFEEAWARASADPTRFCFLPPVFDVVAERV
jgi:SAM-dependent methyltransferase